MINPSLSKSFAVCCAVVLAFSTLANADGVFNVSVDGITTNGVELDAANTVVVVEVGGEIELRAIAWDVVLTPAGASWYSEPAIAVGDTYDPGTSGAGVFVTPGGGDDTPGMGVPMAYDSGGALDLAAAAIPYIALTDSNGDGSNDFYVEFFEVFDDDTEDPDAEWANGAAASNPTGLGGLDFVTAPEPGSLLVLSAVGSIALLRRRK